MTHRVRRRSYVLLETVVAMGLLIVGLAVIGAQVHGSDQALREMERHIRALRLAEELLGRLELGLVPLVETDETDEEEDDFGPRHPDYGWRLTIEPTALEDMYLLKLEVLFHFREGRYRRDDFRHEEAETLLTLYAMRAKPRPLDFGIDFGLRDEELADLSERFGRLPIPGLDPLALDPTLLAKLEFEEFLAVLPTILESMGLDISQLTAVIPPDLLERLRGSGMLGEDFDELLEPDTSQRESGDLGGRSR